MIGTAENSSNASIDPTGIGGVRVETVDLDTFLKGEPRIDAVKMDIEGAEGLALQGMVELLRRHRPFVFTEFSPRALESVSGTGGEAFARQLVGLGYELRILKRGRAGISGPSSAEQIVQYWRAMGTHHLDLLALPRECQEGSLNWPR